jgi:hypothetical protein
VVIGRVTFSARCGEGISRKRYFRGDMARIRFEKVRKSFNDVEGAGRKS